jgi:hypothetical protein
MIVILYVDVIFHQNLNLPHIYCIFVKKISFFEMKIYKLITWYPNMVHIMWNDMIQYTFKFHKDKKSFKLFLEYICVFEYTSTFQYPTW